MWHGHRPAFGMWRSPYRRPAFRTSAFFTIRFGHPGYSLQFTKFAGRTSWHWWYSYGYACPTWRYRTWWQPTTIFHTWYFPRVTHVHHVYAAPPQPQVRYVEVPREPCPHSFGEAWGMIADGEASLALTAFACLSQEYPYNGLASLGYAIANAMLGADESAVVAMRRAIAIEPESIRFVPSDKDLDQTIMSLAQHFGERAKVPGWRTDGLFMMASLRAVLGDFAGAHFTITEAIRSGDNDPSAHQLRDTLVELLHEELYGS